MPRHVVITEIGERALLAQRLPVDTYGSTVLNETHMKRLATLGRNAFPNSPHLRSSESARISIEPSQSSPIDW